jgi:trk system potassium uptake protein TrkA
MYLIVVGAGSVGSSLVDLASKDGHDVALIEADKDLAQEASDRFDAMVLHANVAQGGILKEAGAEKADVLVATTGDDSANLMAMFLGTEHQIKTLVSVVNEQSHITLFERLGVHVLTDPNEIVAGHLYGLVKSPDIEELFTEPGGAHAFRVKIGDTSPLVGKTLVVAKQEGLLPKGLLLAVVSRGDEVIVPSGDTVLVAQDHLTVFTNQPLSETQTKVFTG